VVHSEQVFVGGVEDSVAVYRAYHGIHPLFSCVSGVEHITHIFHCASQGGDWGPYTEFYKYEATLHEIYASRCRNRQVIVRKRDELCLV